MLTHHILHFLYIYSCTWQYTRRERPPHPSYHCVLTASTLLSTILSTILRIAPRFALALRLLCAASSISSLLVAFILYCGTFLIFPGASHLQLIRRHLEDR